ncbi:MAG: hypothetical protein ABSG97_05155 [Sedimentisphaerales bacterium]
MNTVWLKIVAAVVAIVVVLVLYNKIANHKSAPEQPQKMLSDTFREDDKRLRAEPNIVESNVPAVAERPKFRELTEEEDVGASQLFELAITSRKEGRLPGMHYGAMVQYCRQIIEKYPGSEYAYKAKRMLGDIPERDRERYHITPDELDLSK